MKSSLVILAESYLTEEKTGLIGNQKKLKKQDVSGFTLLVKCSQHILMSTYVYSLRLFYS